MSEASCLDVLHFVAKWNEKNKTPFSLDDLLMAFPGNESDFLLEKLNDLVECGFIEKTSEGFYVPTQLGFEELAKV